MTARRTHAAASAAIAVVGLIATASSPSSAATTTIRFNDTTTAIQDVEMDVYVSSGVDRSRGHLVGYSTARYVVGDDGLSVLEGTFALRDGTIHFRATYVQDREEPSHGRVTGGTGSYDDARGAITLRPVDADTSRVRITIKG
jgi:hypothetical protein